MRKGSSAALIVGEGTLPLVCAKELLERGYRICGVVSPDRRVQAWADAQAIPWALNCDAYSASNSEEFDYLLSIVNFAILPEHLVNLARKLAINYHDSLLPTYAGLHSTSWAIMNCESQHGVTWHVMDSSIDTGDILVQRAVPIELTDTVHALNLKCYFAAVSSFRELVDGLDTGSLTRVRQETSIRSYFGKFKRPPAACAIDFEQDARHVDAFIRSLSFGSSPNPIGSPKIIVESKWYSVSYCRMLSVSSGLQPGRLVGASGGRLQVTTLTTDVELSGLTLPCGEKLEHRDRELLLAAAENGASLTLDHTLSQRVSAYFARVCRHEEFWTQRILAETSLVIEADTVAGPPVPRQPASEGDKYFVSPDIRPSVTALAAVMIALASSCHWSRFSVELILGSVEKDTRDFRELFELSVPMVVEIDSRQSFSEVSFALDAYVREVDRRGTFATDLRRRRNPRPRGCERQEKAGCESAARSIVLCVDVESSVSFPKSLLYKSVILNCDSDGLALRNVGSLHVGDTCVLTEWVLGVRSLAAHASRFSPIPVGEMVAATAVPRLPVRTVNSLEHNGS